MTSCDARLDGAFPGPTPHIQHVLDQYDRACNGMHDDQGQHVFPKLDGSGPEIRWLPGATRPVIYSYPYQHSITEEPDIEDVR